VVGYTAARGTTAGIRAGAAPSAAAGSTPVLHPTGIAVHHSADLRRDRVLMFRIDGINGESIVVDGNWVEKLRTGTSRGRNPADQYSGTDVKEFSRRKKLFGTEKEHLLQVIVSVGTFYSLQVPAERRADVDALISELEKARASATS
jgi:hypothetical protein